MTFLTNLGVIGILWCFRLILEGKAGKEKFESSILDFLEKVSANKRQKQKQKLYQKQMTKYTQAHSIKEV